MEVCSYLLLDGMTKYEVIRYIWHEVIRYNKILCAWISEYIILQTSLRLGLVDGMRGVGLIQGIRRLQCLEVEREFYLIGKLQCVDNCSNLLNLPYLKNL